MKKKYNDIYLYLDKLFPNPKCELNYFNDYSLLIAIMLSAQTTDKRVNEVTNVLFNKYKSLSDLANASLDELKQIIYPLGNYNKKALNVKMIAEILFNEYDGVVPNNRIVLEKLPGVGHKTVNVFFSEYFNIPAFAVDTHVERVSKRLSLVCNDDNVNKIENVLMKNTMKDEWGRRHLQMVLFGRYICKAKNPLCDECQLGKICSFKNLK